MFWVSTFFKVVEATEDTWFLDLNASFHSNLKVLEHSTWKDKIYKEISAFLKEQDYDKKIRISFEIVKKVKSQTLRYIKNNKAEIIKYDRPRDLFYIKSIDFPKFHYNSDKGTIFPRQISKDMRLFRSFGSNVSSYDFRQEVDGGEDARHFYNKNRSLKSSNLNNCIKLIEFKFFEIGSGLSFVGVMEQSDGTKLAIIFDSGTFKRGKRNYWASEIIDYLEKWSIDTIEIIISHWHYDHYSVLTTDIFVNYLSLKETSVIYYSDVDTFKKLKIISACKNKWPINSTKQIFANGLIELETFTHKTPMSSKFENERSMIMKIDGITLCSDQGYDNIPMLWKNNVKVFQVPHHGSIHSGVYTSASNNDLNIIPNGDQWDMKSKNKSLVDHFKTSKSAKEF